jgi:hypothetical protein
MQFINPTDIQALKPKKDGTTYFAQLMTNKKKEIKYKLETAVILPSSAGTTLVIKHKPMCLYMADLNEHIINLVKDNCLAWFNNNMAIDLIEDYFVTPLKFHKQHGNVIKLKMQGAGLDNYDPDKKYNMMLVLKGLRFLKQKFSLEWEIREHERCMPNDLEFDLLDSDSIASEDDEELPEPIPDDVDAIKQDIVTHLSMLQTKVQDKIHGLGQVLEEVTQLLEESKNAESLETFTKIQDILETNENFYINNI